MSTWPTVALAEVAAIERTSVQPEDIEAGTTYVGLENVESGGTFLGAGPIDAGVLGSSKFRFTEKHVLYGKLRPYLAKIACPDFNGICSTDILPILPGPKVERRYLFHFLRQPSMVNYASSRAVGVNLPRLSPSVLETFLVPLPPLPEQRRIAQVLDRAEALRAKRRAVVAQLDALAQSIFLDLFGDPATNPKGWPRVSIESVAGIIVPTRDKPKYFRGTIPWVTLPDLDGLFISRAKNLLTVEDAEEVGNRLIPSNSVLLSCAGTLGKIAITTTHVYANQQFYGLVPQGDKLDTTFFALCLLLRGETFFSKLGGSFTIGFFSKQKALDIQIPLPPVSLQREFAGRVTALEKLRSAYREASVELDALFASLQYRAFRGEL
jgi:type I restriction enzyme, S subunit